MFSKKLKTLDPDPKFEYGSSNKLFADPCGSGSETVYQPVLPFWGSVWIHIKLDFCIWIHIWNADRDNEFFSLEAKIIFSLYGSVDLLVMRIRIRVDPPLLVPTIISNAEIDQGFFSTYSKTEKNTSNRLLWNFTDWIKRKFFKILLSWVFRNIITYQCSILTHVPILIITT
jgi:hypothetical protein